MRNQCKLGNTFYFTAGPSFTLSNWHTVAGWRNSDLLISASFPELHTDECTDKADKEREKLYLQCAAGFWLAVGSALALLKQEASKGQSHTWCLLFLLVRRARDWFGYSTAAAKTQAPFHHLRICKASPAFSALTFHHHHPRVDLQKFKKTNGPLWWGLCSQTGQRGEEDQCCFGDTSLKMLDG